MSSVPEVHVVRLECDYNDGEQGTRILVDDGLRPMEVILCVTHRKALTEITVHGRPANGSRTRRSRGSDRDRLDNLWKPDSD